MLLTLPQRHVVIRIPALAWSLRLAAWVRARWEPASMVAITKQATILHFANANCVTLVAFALCVCVASPCLHPVESVLVFRWPSFSAVRLLTRREAALVAAVSDLALNASVFFAILSALVASHLDVVLGATPGLHLIESVFVCIVCIWPRLGTARRITYWIPTSVAAIDELFASSLLRSARRLQL